MVGVAVGVAVGVGVAVWVGVGCIWIAGRKRWRTGGFVFGSVGVVAGAPRLPAWADIPSRGETMEIRTKQAIAKKAVRREHWPAIYFLPINAEAESRKAAESR